MNKEYFEKNIPGKKIFRYTIEISSYTILRFSLLFFIFVESRSCMFIHGENFLVKFYRMFGKPRGYNDIFVYLTIIL